MIGEARQLWRELKNRPMLADSLSLASHTALQMGDYGQAVKYSDETLQISQATNNIWGQCYSRMWVGAVYWEYGQPDEAITIFVDGIRLSDLVGFVSAQIVTRADLAVFYAELGAPERGVELINQTLEFVASGNRFEFHRPYIMAAMTRIQLSLGNLAGAETAQSQAKTEPGQPEISIFIAPALLAQGALAFGQQDYDRTVAVTDDLRATLHRYDMRKYLPDCLYLQGQALQALGREETAFERLLEAKAVAEGIGSRRMLWRVLFALSRLESDPTEAKRLQQQAREIVAYIADHTPLDLRDSFLSLPERTPPEIG